jgi:hypothetical protein
VSDWCGDLCGFAEPGTPWQLHVQTAGAVIANDKPAPAELVVYCLDDPEGFRSKIMTAKRGLTITPATGAAKDAVLVGGTGMFSSPHADTASVLAVLERIERAVNEGVQLAASRSR